MSATCCPVCGLPLAGYVPPVGAECHGAGSTGCLRRVTEDRLRLAQALKRIAETADNPDALDCAPWQYAVRVLAGGEP